MKKLIRPGGIVFVTLGMLWLTFFFMQLPWLAGDEKFLIWSTSAIKLTMRDVPNPEDFALINTSYDLKLIDRFDEFGFPIGNQVVTDRGKLATLLNIVKASERQPKYILCDIHFVDPTEDDEALASALSGVEPIIVSAHLNDAGEMETPIFSGVKYGLSDYVIGNIFDGIYKYQLFYQDTLKLTPLKIHEAIQDFNSRKKGPFVRTFQQWMPNNFIVNYRVLQKDISNPDSGFNPISLGELLILPDEDIQDFLADKTVVIGDFFEQDMHETLFEITSGPLILLNTLLTLEEGETYVNIWFFLLLLLVYGYLSFMVVYEGDFLEKQVRSRFGKVKVAKYLAGFMSYLAPLSILSILTFFIFNIHLNVFYLAVVYYLLDRIIGIGYTRFNQRL